MNTSKVSLFCAHSSSSSSEDSESDNTDLIIDETPRMEVEISEQVKSKAAPKPPSIRNSILPEVTKIG